jgi:hypothetical protein
MKKLVVLLMASLFIAGSALAVVDTDSNQVGIYFDDTADTFCLSGLMPYTPFTGYVMLTNPEWDSIGGFEFGYDIMGSYFLTNTVLPPQAIDVGEGNNHIVGLGAPLVCTPATPLVVWSFVYAAVDGSGLEFFIHDSTPASLPGGYPVILLADATGTLVQVGTSTELGTVNAIVNGECTVVAEEETSFGSLKSLYR